MIMINQAAIYRWEQCIYLFIKCLLNWPCFFCGDIYFLARL